MAESEEELKSQLVKEENEKAGLKLNIQTTDGETMERVTDFIFLGSKITVEWLQPWN